MFGKMLLQHCNVTKETVRTTVVLFMHQLSCDGWREAAAVSVMWVLALLSLLFRPCHSYKWPSIQMWGHAITIKQMLDVVEITNSICQKPKECRQSWFPSFTFMEVMSLNEWGFLVNIVFVVITIYLEAYCVPNIMWAISSHLLSI